MTNIEEKVRQLIRGTSFIHGKRIPPASSRYLHLAENIVRQAVFWQNEDGRIIDPYKKKETNTLTARFVGALGLLILKGRCLDLAGACARALTPALEDLFHKKTDWGEFIAKEACMAYIALKDQVQPELSARWRHLLGDYDPEQSYGRTFTNNPSDLHNYCTFAIAGEALKQKYGLADNGDFIERYVEQQLTRFDQNGMYNDPRSPMTYDMVPRMNLSLALWAGYTGQHYEKLSETLKLGALSQLLYQSPVGECPFGGRSNQQNFNEVTFALICEFEAVRWVKQGDLAMAGAFKRAAALAINSIEKYLQETPIFFTKNQFPAETQHGRQIGYGFYGAYSLLIASQLGFASILADENIKEAKCPAECGGYVFITEKSFHKIFAMCAGHHIEIDTNADFDYDATGLGRVHFANCPAEFVLSIPITARPGYLVSCNAAPRNVSIGPGWLADNGARHWLADYSGTANSVCMEVSEENAKATAFKLEYRNVGNCDGIIEEYRIDNEGIAIKDTIRNYDKEFAVQIPLLVTDGMNKSEIKIDGKSFIVKYGNFSYRAECTYPENAELYIEDFDAPNRNGIYRVGVFKAHSNTIEYKISLF